MSDHDHIESKRCPCKPTVEDYRPIWQRVRDAHIKNNHEEMQGAISDVLKLEADIQRYVREGPEVIGIPLQWELLRERVEAIEELFESAAEFGVVEESAIVGAMMLGVEDSMSDLLVAIREQCQLSKLTGPDPLA
jgi:hypothetical protein